MLAIDAECDRSPRRYHGCECVCDELKVKNPEKKFGMAVDVRFLI